jgi:hypothetical protein
MIRPGCVAVRRQLAAFYDGELAIEDQVRVEGHLRGCEDCEAEASRYRAIGDAVRGAASFRTAPAGALDGLAEGVVGRLTAERNESFSGTMSRMFEDLHLLWAALGATGSAVACVALVMGIFYFAGSEERPDSLAGLLSALASPGSDANPVVIDPRMALPRANPDDVPAAVPADGDSVYTFAAVLTREGRIKRAELVQGDWSGGTPQGDDSDMVELLDSVSNARFEPARSGGAPVAVNMVWMLAHLTVRPKVRGESLLMPSVGVSMTYRLA